MKKLLSVNDVAKYLRVLYAIGALQNESVTIKLDAI